MKGSYSLAGITCYPIIREPHLALTALMWDNQGGRSEALAHLMGSVTQKFLSCKTDTLELLFENNQDETQTEHIKDFEGTKESFIYIHTHRKKKI